MRKDKFTSFAVIISSILILAAAYVFLSNAWIDLAVSRYFYSPQTGFLFNQYYLIYLIRSAIIWAYGIWYMTIVASIIICYRKTEQVGFRFLKLEFHQWVYLAISSFLGPFLVANAILKNNWGRARPRQVTEFGGTMEFSPALILSDQCKTNCSFVSGEPSSMFMVFISLAFIIPGKRAIFSILAVITGSASGIMRIGQGGHFLSDVIFSALFMLFIAAFVYWAMCLSAWAKKNRWAMQPK